MDSIASHLPVYFSFSLFLQSTRELGEQAVRVWWRDITPPPKSSRGGAARTLEAVLID